MSDHLDAAGPTGVSDLFAFQKPGDPSKTILILDVDPMAPSGHELFEPEASYEIEIDTNGDAQADLAYHVRFAPSGNGSQVATVHKVSGPRAEHLASQGDVVVRDAPVSDGGAPRVTVNGGYRFFAGMRSDPFFADLVGFQNNLQFTGDDYFADKNVLAIALEVPNAEFGANGQLGLWARTVAPVHGTLSKVDQIGRPVIGATFTPADEDLHRFNQTDPAHQREAFLAHFAGVLQGVGYSETEATEIAGTLLPDILPYDYRSPEGYPNGRKPADDVVDPGVSLLTRGQITSDKVGPHRDLLNDFPYLGAPH